MILYKQLYKTPVVFSVLKEIILWKIFKFPDENEPKKVEAAADEQIEIEIAAPEIEVIDDTPPEDQGRKAYGGTSKGLYR